MTAVILIIVGIIFMIGSFFVTEKLSQKEVTQISQLSSAEMKRILEKNMETARQQVEELVEQVIEQSVEATTRDLEKETNLKIQNISEYSQGVLESIDKNHQEVMFLYSMLNEKHTELTETAGKLEKLKTTLDSMEEKVKKELEELQEQMNQLEQREISYIPVSQPVVEEEAKELEEPEETPEEFINNNQRILQLHQQGTKIKDIAKQLGLGVGEVRLVIDLYREGEA